MASANIPQSFVNTLSFILIGFSGTINIQASDGWLFRRMGRQEPFHVLRLVIELAPDLRVRDAVAVTQRLQGLRVTRSIRHTSSVSIHSARRRSPPFSASVLTLSSNAFTPAMSVSKAVFSMITISIPQNFIGSPQSYTPLCGYLPDKGAVAACGAVRCATSGHDGNRRLKVPVGQDSTLETPIQAPARRKIHKNLT